ncbi:tranport-associated late exocytosis protein [Ceratobasidium sp. AG-Ba]|nr:tranport-associated late exocytosis protein [Ceratobasidium sp. AG-Ba]
MATIYDRGAATYDGLLQQTYAAIIVGTVCLALVETLRRVPRRRGRGKPARTDPSDTGETRGLAPQDAEAIKALGSRENWTNAYLYMGRCWSVVPSPPHPKRPLVWIWQVLRTPDETFLQLAGVDATVYTRFLRACFYFTALHTCTTLVVILPIHYILSPSDIKRSDINRGSLTTLVSGLAPSGRKILWVHMVMLIWITVSWMLFLTWFVLGSLRYRAYAARHVPAPVASTLSSAGRSNSRKPTRPADDTSSFPAGAYTTGTIFPLHPEPAPIRSPSTDADGSGPDYSLRCRTIMMTNIPQNIREPRMLRWYFGRYLPEPPKQGESEDEESHSKPWRKIVPSRARQTTLPVEVTKPPNGKLHKINPELSKGRPLDPHLYQDAAVREFEMDIKDVGKVDARGMELVESVVLAPKLSGLASLIQMREKEIENLEEAHIALAKAVMNGVTKEMHRREKEENRKVREGELRRRQWMREELRRKEGRRMSGSEEDGGGWLGSFRDKLERGWWVLERFIWGEPDRSSEVDELLRKIGPFVEEAQARDSEYGIGVWSRGVSKRIKLRLTEGNRDPSVRKEGEDGSEDETPVDERVKRQAGNGANGYSNRNSKDANILASPSSPISKPLTSPSPTPGANDYDFPGQHKLPSQAHDSIARDDTVWAALHSLPPESLHRFHPYTRRGSILWYPFELVGLRTPTLLPTIDLSFLRIKKMARRIEEIKSKPLPDAKEKSRHRDDMGKVTDMDKGFPNANDEDPMNHPSERHSSAIAPASSAFVTFRRWEDARRAARLLSHRPGRPLTCIVTMAPQSTDLDWERLVKGKFAAQFLRDWLVGVAIWVFQIFWIFPISFITGLVSIKTLENVLPLTDFFKRNPRIQSLLTGLIPTLLVAGLGILIPVILFAIGRKAQSEVTFSGLHNGILIRYYKWLILNIVIFFCIGLASFRTFLLAFKQQVPDPFKLVSESFPAAAPFYASWFILQTSLQNMMQLGLVGLPLITYVFGVRKASTPRKRKRGTQPRTIDYHYWTPNHLLAMHIVLIFAVLNPLVIPFALIYYSVANVVFRNQLLHVYARRFYEGNGKMITIRVLRYSMDGLALAHVVFLAFNLLNYNRARAGISGTLLGITIILKIWATRELEDAESARLCGHEEPFLAPGERSSNEDTRSPTGAVSSSAPLSHERLNAFQSPAAAMSPSTFTWNPPGLRTIGHKYNVHRVRESPMKGKQRSLSAIVSRSNSIAEVLRPGSSNSKRPGSPDINPDIKRPESPGASDEAPSIAATGTKLLGISAPQMGGIFDLVQQVPGAVAGLFTGKSEDETMEEGVNYLGGMRPKELIVAQPPLKRWDDSPNGSASYECPYYLDVNPQAIWLPRDPSGPVDLDDTVLMYRLLLNIHRSGTSDPPRDKVSTDDQVKDESDRRPSMVTNGSAKSGMVIPVTQSPAQTPDETPGQNRTSSFSSRAARPSLLRVRTASTDRVNTHSSPWGRRQSISEALEMTNLQIPTHAHPQQAHTLPAALGETSAQGPVRGRQASLLSAFRSRRRSEAEDGADPPASARPVSMFSFNSGAEGAPGESRTERRRGRILPADDVRKALDDTVAAEEQKHEDQLKADEDAEDREDKRVENEETKGWGVLKRLVFKKQTEP